MGSSQLTKKLIVGLIVAGFLANLTGTMTLVSETIFGMNPTGLDSGGTSGENPALVFVNFIFIALAVAGWIAFGKGFMELNKEGSEQGRSPIWHILFGGLLVNAQHFITQVGLWTNDPSINLAIQGLGIN